MSFNFFGFGRKRTRKTRKSTKKAVKPAKSLVRLCKKYGVKVTKKSGSKRTYKKTAVLKKQCAKKIRSLIKRKSKFGARRGSRFGVRPTSRRMPLPTRMTRRARIMGHIRRHRGKYSGLGTALSTAATLAALRRAGYINLSGTGKASGQYNRAKHAVKERRMQYDDERSGLNNIGQLYDFGKRRRRGRRGIRRYRFGNGGNPSLSSSMGYEFCSGGGGVLGANSTGLFPSPCMGGAMMGSGPAAAFGKRRRRRTTRRRM